MTLRSHIALWLWRNHIQFEEIRRRFFAVREHQVAWPGEPVSARLKSAVFKLELELHPQRAKAAHVAAKCDGRTRIDM